MRGSRVDPWRDELSLVRCTIPRTIVSGVVPLTKVIRKGVLVAGLINVTAFTVPGWWIEPAAGRVANEEIPGNIGESIHNSSGPAESYLLGPGDQITVHCMNAEEFGSEAIRVDGDGSVTIPFLGRVKVGGLSVRQVQQVLTRDLRQYILNPVVSVNLVSAQSQPVSVIGAVKTPGVIQLQGSKTLLEVLSTAGGLREDAGRTVRVTRQTKYPRIPLPNVKKVGSSLTVADFDVKELIDLKTPGLNIQIFPNDVISVSATGIVYVVGEVHRPGGFPLHDRASMSVLQVISLAEGLEHTAAASKARIVRQSSSDQRVDIPINLKDVLSGHKADVALRADDILFIPNNAAKSAGLKALDSVIQLGTGVVIYGRY